MKIYHLWIFKKVISMLNIWNINIGSSKVLPRKVLKHVLYHCWIIASRIYLALVANDIEDMKWRMKTLILSNLTLLPYKIVTQNCRRPCQFQINPLNIQKNAYSWIWIFRLHYFKNCLDASHLKTISSANADYQ